MITHRLSIAPFLVAFLVGLMAMPGTNIFKICRNGVGFLDVSPWLNRSADALSAALRMLIPIGWLARLWRPRVAFACAAALLVLLVADLSASHYAQANVLSAVVVMAGTRRTQLESEMREATAQAKALMTTAEKENRELAEEERAKVQGHLDEAKRLKMAIERIDGDVEMRKQIEALNASATPPTAAGAKRAEGRMTLGQRFVNSELYAAITSGKHRQPGFSMSIDVPEIGATTLDESSGSGGKIVLPDYQQGIVPLLFRVIRVTQLLAPGSTNSNSVEYMQETTFTNAAATRAESAASAESTLVFNRTAETVRSIAHFLPVTNEMLEDSAQAESYIDGRLRLGLDLVEEDQLLNGDGAGTNLTGLMNRANLATAVARGADTNADAIFKQIAAIMKNAFVLPDGVVLNPDNWTTILLSKDGNGQYYGMGPFAAMQTPILWGLPAAVTPVIAANTALVGAYRACAQRFVRRGGTVTATNSHSDFFTKRLTAIMAEMREALAVYRPGGIGKVTGLN